MPLFDAQNHRKKNVVAYIQLLALRLNNIKHGGSILYFKQLFLPLFDAKNYSGIIRARAEVHMLVAI